MSTHTTWYHGTPFDFETFDVAYLGKGNDQLGSGFYFTDNESTAYGYAHAGESGTGRIIVASLAMERPLPEEADFSAAQVEAMLRASTSFEDAITNWGEIGFEPEAVVVGRAVAAYVEMCEGCEDALQVLNAISNDFWAGREGEFLRAVHKVTGYDGLIRKSGDERHAVVWFPEQVSVIEFRETGRPAVPTR